jgi:hypothetical protein
MVFTHNFETTNHNLHLKKGEQSLDLISNLVEDCAFSFDTHWAFFVEHHSKDVFPLDDGDALLDHVFTHPV